MKVPFPQLINCVHVFFKFNYFIFFIPFADFSFLLKERDKVLRRIIKLDLKIINFKNNDLCTTIYKRLCLQEGKTLGRKIQATILLNFS